MQVKKRNGNIVEFDREKIYRALWSAFTDVYQDADKEDKISNTVDRAIVLLRAAPRDVYEISEIQSVVEKALVDVEEYSVAKAYTDYRLEHDIQRKKQTSVEYQVNRFFEKDDDVVNENANKDSELYSTQRDLIAGAVSKAVGLKKLPQDVADAHVKGILHWHDLDYSPSTSEHNCGLINLKDMLENGFRLGNADVEPPKSLSTAVAVASQVLASIGGSQFGGMSYDRLDEVLAPYAEMSYNKYLGKAKEYHIIDPINYAKKETIKEIKDCCQSLEYEVNTLFSSQGQTPFCTFGFGLGENWFAREIQKGILNQRIKGLGKDGRTAIFPFN